MGIRGLVILRATSSSSQFLNTFKFNKTSLLSKSHRFFTHNAKLLQSYTVRSTLEPPDLHRLAETARISLTPHEIEEFAPKIQQVVDWFGQLQGVDLQSVQPSIRADFDGQNMRDDLPETFENREPMIAAVPNYEDPFIKVPKVLNKE